MISTMTSPMSLSDYKNKNKVRLSVLPAPAVIAKAVTETQERKKKNILPQPSWNYLDIFCDAIIMSLYDVAIDDVKKAAVLT